MLALPSEVWKDIEGYEGLYQVSSLGNIRSLDRYVKHKLIKGRNMRLKVCCGYLRVGLRQVNIGQKTFLIHRLVAQAFIPNPDKLPQVNHKDENKENNCVDNLEWCTATYNINYGTRNKKCGDWQKQNSKLKKAICQYTLDGQFVAEFPSISEAERQLGLFSGSIIKSCKAQTKSAGGYIWRYA